MFSYNIHCMWYCCVVYQIFRFRHLLSQENNGKHTPHRTQVAIKEHGVLISASKAMVEPFDFWVIGYVQIIHWEGYEQLWERRCGKWIVGWRI